MMCPPAVPLLLASASPRRSTLLEQIGVAHRTHAVAIDETPQPGEPALALVIRLAREKALAGRAYARPGESVLGADTVVVLEGVVFGKPRDEQDAVDMLTRLGGRRHEVLTAIAIASPGDPLREAVSRTEVAMRPISPREARQYWAGGEPRDKAGGYAIQGHAAVFIEEIRGSYSGVMGLPLCETAQLLAQIRAPGAET